MLLIFTEKDSFLSNTYVTFYFQGLTQVVNIWSSMVLFTLDWFLQLLWTYVNTSVLSKLRGITCVAESRIRDNVFLWWKLSTAHHGRATVCSPHRTLPSSSWAGSSLQLRFQYVVYLSFTLLWFQVLVISIKRNSTQTIFRQWVLTHRAQSQRTPGN